MKCSKCGQDVKNFPEHLAGLADVVCKKCAGAPPPPKDLEGVTERYMGRLRPPRLEVDDDLQAA